jgi:uncharacterized protein (TIGR02246 family)
VHRTIVLVLGAMACIAAGPQDDEASIRAALNGWMADFNAGRANAVCDLFAPDLRFDFRGQPERGYEEMCAQLRRALSDKQHHFSYALRMKEVLVSGDLAIVRLVWSLTTAGETTVEPGLDVFHRQPDGSWKIIRYMAYEEGP